MDSALNLTPPAPAPTLPVAQPAAIPQIDYPELPSSGHPFSPPKGMLDYADYGSVRRYMLDRMKAEMSIVKPVSNDRFELSVHSVDYVGKDPSIQDEERAIREGKSLSRRLAGKYTLKDKTTGQTYTTNRRTMMNVPWMTKGGFYVIGGVPYAFKHQFRMDPGIYVRKTEDGTSEAQFNVEQGTGIPFRIRLDPESGVFAARLAGRNIPLYHLLTAMGVKDDAIQKAWGPQLFATNQRKKPHSSSVNWLAKATEAEKTRLALETGVQPDQIAPVTAMTSYFNRMRLGEENTTRLMGKPYPTVTPDAMLHATQRVLNVANSREDSDSRDNPSNQKLFDEGDHFATYLRLDRGGVMRTALWKLRNDPERLTKITPALFDQHIGHHVNNAGLVQTLDQVNPLDAMNQAQAVTRLGEGAIENLESAPMDAREVQSGYLNFVDSIRAPESLRIGLDMYLARTSVKGPDNRMYARFMDTKTGKTTWLNPIQLEGEFVGNPGSAKSPDRFIQAMSPRHGVQYLPKAKVRYELLSGDDLFSSVSDSIPLKSGVKGMRQLMGCLHGETELEVYRGNGTVEICRAEDYNWQPGDRMRSLDPDVWGRVTLEPVRGMRISTAHRPMRMIDTKRIRSTCTTDDHTWVVVNSITHELEEMQAAYLKQGMLVPVDVGQVETDPIVSIVDLPYAHLTYDIDLGGRTYMLANGLFVHNSKFLMHALPLVDGEAPLVQTPSRDGSPSATYLGGFAGAVRSPVDGTVISVGKHGAVIRGADGKDHAESWYDWIPFARKTFLEQKPVVKVGDTVKKNGLLARSNYTDAKGRLAIGRNLRVAYMGYKGENFEDGTVISQSAADKLTSNHMYRHEFEKEPGKALDRTKFVSLFPAVYTREQLMGIDGTGVIKPGTEIRRGDPLLLAVGAYEPGVSTMGRRINSDKSETWDYEEPGVVRDVVRTRNGVRIFVDSKHKMNIGDKAALPFGAKGVMAEVVPDDQMMQDEQGRPMDILLSPKSVPSRCYDDQTEFLSDRGWLLGKDVLRSDRLLSFETGSKKLVMLPQDAPMFVQRFCGELICGHSQVLDFRVTPGHKMWARSLNVYSPWRETTIDRMYGKILEVPVAGEAIAGQDTDFVLPEMETYSVKDNQSVRGPIVIPAPVFAELLGWYLSEGNTTYTEWTPTSKAEFKVHIAQNQAAHPEHCRQIEVLLQKLPFSWHFGKGNQQFHIASKRLAHYLKQFGKCADKWIPDWIFQQSFATRQLFLDTFWKGDGTRHGTKDSIGRHAALVETAGSRSQRLVDDLQRLWVYQGQSASVRSIKTKNAHQPMWRCGVHHKKTRCVARSMWTKVPYDGLVYCPTVATGYVVTRRNGNILIAGNTNPAQLPVAQLGKIAAKTGKPYLLTGFSDDDISTMAEKELAAHGMSDTETLYDPRTGKNVPGVFTGVTYTYKLQQMAEDKGHARETGGYSVDEDPSRGGSGASGKHIGDMEISALLAHGAVDTLKDLKTIHGQSNPDFWRQVKLGGSPVVPRTPEVYNKFRALIRASGVTLNETPKGDTVFAATDKDLQKLTGNREITSAETYDRQMRPIRSGLFDADSTGSLGAGDRFAHITLPEPMLNPLMEPVARHILGLRVADLEDIMTGKRPVDGKVGGTAVQALLSKISLPDVIRSAKETLNNSTSAAKRDAAAKQLMYAQAMEQRGLTPTDFLMTRVPVLPPKYRRIVEQGDRLVVPDLNYLYRRLIHAKDDLATAQELGPEAVSDARGQLLHAYRAVVGTEDPQDKDLQAKRVGGVLQQLLGKGSPKGSMVQRKVVGFNIDLSGLGVLIPNPSMKLNEVGIPTEYAWSLFGPFVIRRMVEQGRGAMEASRAIKEHTGPARAALDAVMKERPVVLNRAPTLHKHGIVSLHAKAVPGRAVQVSPQLDAPLGADHDGDMVSFTVPVSKAAVKEAWARMSPDNNLLSVRNGQPHYAPSQELHEALYIMTKSPQGGKSAKVFNTKADMVAAWRRGEIQADDPVQTREV